MIIEPEESARFFRAWWPLLHFTNREQGIFPQIISSSPTKPPPTMETALRIRNALWSDPILLQRFVKENPHSLPPADLALAESWQHRVEGTFFVFRHLQRHTVLIDDDASRAFAVNGLQSSFRDLLGPEVPLAVKAVLLPFEEKIVYDGLLVPYPIVFGSGIRRSLKETYDRIRERDAIIATLPPTERMPKSDPASVERRNAKLLDEFRRHSYLAGRSTATVERDVTALRTLAGESARRAGPTRVLIDISAADLRADTSSGEPSSRAASQARLRFARFLHETGRIENRAA